MPKVLLRIDAEVEWLRTIIQRGEHGIEREIHLRVGGKPLRVAFDSMPGNRFLRALLDISCLRIFEFTKEERGWNEPGRYLVLLNDDDDLDQAEFQVDRICWGPVNRELIE